MTNEEAIDILRNAAWLGTDADREQIENAVEMAINALTAQPETHEERTETHSCDSISRQAAINAIPHKIKGLGGESWMMTYRRSGHNDCVDACLDAIRHLPSAPQRAGRWIHDGYAFKGGIDWMHCSECGHKDSWSVATRTPFCGWCGARMEDER